MLCVDEWVESSPSDDEAHDAYIWPLEDAVSNDIGVVRALEVTTDTEPEKIVPFITSLELIAVRFDKFADGRGHSLAHILRQRLGYRGELRAVGDINREQLAYLERCGFDAFVLKDGKDPADAISGFVELETLYQGAPDSGPLWRRGAERVDG